MKNDNTIEINIDNFKINHTALNRFIKELEDLSTKYSIITVNKSVRK